jgi:hypothetical protein
VRPDAQIFVHVLAATVLFGATAAIAVLGFAARSRADRLTLARASLRTVLVLAIPAWALTLAFGSWAESKGNWPDGIGWIDLGAGVTDAGLVILLALAAIAFRWSRRPETSWAPTAVAALASLHLAALAVAWWVMTAKVPT